MIATMFNKTLPTHGIDALRLPGESCTDIDLACRAIHRFGLSAGARFCQKQGIALEDCLAALKLIH